MNKKESIKLIKKIFTKEIKKLGYKINFVKTKTFDLNYIIYEPLNRAPVALNHVKKLNEEEIIKAVKEMVIMIDEDHKRKIIESGKTLKEKNLWTYEWSENNIHDKDNVKIIVLPFLQILSALHKKIF